MTKKLRVKDWMIERLLYDLAKGFVWNGLEGLRQKSLLKHLLGLVLGEATPLDVGEGQGIEVYRGGAMGALDIVGFDGKLGTGIDDRLVGEQPPLVVLGSHDALALGRDVDGPIKEGGGSTFPHASVVLCRGGVRAVMMDGCMEGKVGVGMAAVDALQGGTGRWATQTQGHLVTYQRRIERGRSEILVACAAGGLRYVCVTEVMARTVVYMQGIVGQMTIRGQDNLGDAVHEHRGRERRRSKDLHHGSLALGTQDNECPRIARCRRERMAMMVEEDGLGQLGVGRHVNKTPLAKEGGVEGHPRV